MKLIRISTAGSVDDGKSTLIGRLLYDSKSLFEDQIEHVFEASKKKNIEGIDYSLFTDGLRDERIQGITIDVAHIYFSTSENKYIIADTPGHVQYTRNMVTGMSNADIALILIDINKGLNEQVKRHIHIAAMLRIPKIIFCVNKMDLVGYDEKPFRDLIDQCIYLTNKLNLDHITFIPISAINGDNVVLRSENMPWHIGRSILEEINQHVTNQVENSSQKRLPIQCVINKQEDAKYYRGYAGMVISGMFSAGEEIIILPAGIRSTIKSITKNGNPVQDAGTGYSIVIELDHEIDITRGDLIVGANDLPTASSEITAKVCWMNESPIQQSKKYLLKTGSKEVPCLVVTIISKFANNFEDITKDPVDLLMNDIGYIKLKTSSPIYYDQYAMNKPMGRFILIDPVSNDTVAAGIIE